MNFGLHVLSYTTHHITSHHITLHYITLHYITLHYRILEKAILYGKEKSLKEITEEVLAKLDDAKNPDRGELDANMASHVRKTLQTCGSSHMKATQEIFVKS